MDIGLDVARSAGGDQTVFARVKDGLLVAIEAARQPGQMARARPGHPGRRRARGSLEAGAGRRLAIAIPR